jgi:hypothetical protein
MILLAERFGVAIKFDLNETSRRGELVYGETLQERDFSPSVLE